MNIRRSLMMATIVSTAGALGSQAHAQCGPYGGGYGFGAWDMGRLYGVMADNVPYFAAFPPVYYSAPVPRTYGYSPFAYPPGVMTPDLVETVSEPQVIENPYISPAPTGEGPAMIAPETVDQTTSVAPVRGPQVILNPYVSQTGGASGMASAAGGAAR
ncbi:hypothetical protein [Lacipirellula limnantheis]|uniref:Uncharacterized protein n=1 Tax=Lacipirellula limnantheis TaxID=2528024 RepID=A0A517TZY4_9BACT|nr:hypothetical protein [Lacipirellula limnantheis]QDT73926.1 hypothetical protein I41_31180 [Lacipirellula limnantheis]